MIRALQTLLMVALAAYSMHLIAGRLSARVVFAPLLFLVTRRPILIVATFLVPASYWWLSVEAASNGKSPSFFTTTMIALVIGLPLTFFIVGGVSLVLATRRSKQKFELQQDEALSFKLPANHMFNSESRGGHLYVTGKRLKFIPHRFNVQVNTWSALLADIRSVESEGTRLVVLDVAGKEELLVVMDNNKFAKRLQTAVFA